MAIVPQHATATADSGGDAVFMFPDVPQGELWSGTTTIIDAPPAANSTVTTGGQLVGSMLGAGSYGPWTADHSQRLAISATGLVPDIQYVAVWHADSRAREWSTYPQPITTAVSGTVNVPEPVQVDVLGSVTVDQGSPPWEVRPSVASSVTGGSVTMTGGTVTLPTFAATQGVVLSAPAANAHPIMLNGGLTIAPGQITPVLPVGNSNVLNASGTAPDQLSFLVL